VRDGELRSELEGVCGDQAEQVVNAVKLCDT